MTEPISRNRLLGSLKEAASWPGADRNTVVTLATALVAARADAEGSRYFQDLSERNPEDATAHALAGFFQVRAGHEVAAAISKLDKAATMDLGLPQYFSGLALAELLPGDGPSDRGRAGADTGRADQVVADLEFVLAVRDHFPVSPARRVPGPRPRLPGARPAAAGGRGAATVRPRPGRDGPAAAFHEFLGNCAGRDGLSAPGALNPAPDVHVAQSYDFGDFTFIQTSADRVRAAIADLA